tara:strand:- start:25 stop:393 length:369 start_codon:yes stop_codon:yes gene_type:complete
MIFLLRKKFSEKIRNRKVKEIIKFCLIYLVFLLFVIVLYKLSTIQNKSFKNIILNKKNIKPIKVNYNIESPKITNDFKQNNDIELEKLFNDNIQFNNTDNIIDEVRNYPIPLNNNNDFDYNI